MGEILKNPAKRDQLKWWMRNKGTFCTHEVLEFGLKNFHNRADRDKRDFAEAGLIKAIPHEEAMLRGLKGKEGWYEWVV